MSWFKYFIAPDETSPKHMAVWRQWIGLGMVFIWLFAWWAMGAFASVAPWAGQGFAKAEVVASIQVSFLEKNILDLRIRHCNASTADGRAFLFNLLQAELSHYKEITGREYTLPACADLAGLS